MAFDIFDSIFTHLETLKKEAAEVTKKVEETDVVMAEVEAVSAQYRPLAQSCSSVYFTLESLNQVYFLYQFSLQFFLDIFLCTLYKNTKLHGIKDYHKRLPIIVKELFQLVYSRVARGMLHHDRLTFAMLLSRIYLRGTGSGEDLSDEFEHFLRGSEAAISTKDSEDISGLSQEQVRCCLCVWIQVLMVGRLLIRVNVYKHCPRGYFCE
jgi:dynein heavy chain 1